MGGVVALGLVVLITLNVPTVQNAMFERASLRTMSQNQQLPKTDGMRVVVCGSASPLGNDPLRAQACIAVVTPEHFYIFDAGAGSQVRIGQAQLPMNRLSGIFLTHFHSDHIAALPDIRLNAWVSGAKSALKVYGPEGVSEVVEGFNIAYKLDAKYRVAHHGADLLTPAAGSLSATTIKAGVVLKDGDLTITAFLVDHSPISPAMGYRVDYGDRSVVISGDTITVDSLFTAAKGADLLFHDALFKDVMDILIPNARKVNRERVARVMTDVIDYHADSKKVENRAREAGVGQLVLYHLVL